LTWTVEWDDRAARELRKLDRQIQKEILAYFRERIATAEDPRRLGRPLFRELAGLWRYRVRDHRLICNIEDGRFVVLAGRRFSSGILLYDRETSVRLEDRLYAVPLTRLWEGTSARPHPRDR